MLSNLYISERVRGGGSSEVVEESQIENSDSNIQVEQISVLTLKILHDSRKVAIYDSLTITNMG